MAPDDPPQLECPLCSGVFLIAPDMWGREVDCPHCAEAIRVPNATPAVTTDGNVLPPRPPSKTFAAPHEAPPIVAFVPAATPIIRPHGKIIRRGDRATELRERSRSERAARQAFRNTLVLILCLAILLAVAYSLSGPPSTPNEPAPSESPPTKTVETRD